MSTVELFEDDLMKRIMARLSVRLQPGVNGEIAVILCDNKTGHGVVCTGARLKITHASHFNVSMEDGASGRYYEPQTEF